MKFDFRVPNESKFSAKLNGGNDFWIKHWFQVEIYHFWKVVFNFGQNLLTKFVIWFDDVLDVLEMNPMYLGKFWILEVSSFRICSIFFNFINKFLSTLHFRNGSLPKLPEKVLVSRKMCLQPLRKISSKQFLLIFRFWRTPHQKWRLYNLLIRKLIKPIKCLTLPNPGLLITSGRMTLNQSELSWKQTAFFWSRIQIWQSYHQIQL